MTEPKGEPITLEIHDSVMGLTIQPVEPTSEESPEDIDE